MSPLLIASVYLTCKLSLNDCDIITSRIICKAPLINNYTLPRKKLLPSPLDMPPKTAHFEAPSRAEDKMIQLDTQ